MGTFLPLSTPIFPPFAPKTSYIWVIYHKLSYTHLTYLSCDIYSTNNIYTGIYRELGTFLPIFTPVFTSWCPQNEGNLDDISKVVIYTSNLPLI